MQRQQSIRNSISCTGVGLHSGVPATMTLRPAGVDTGIVFHRTDVKDIDPLIPARWDYVVDTMMCTTIGNECGVQVATIEHIMAALAGCKIDNIIVELDGPEAPVMDGSSAPFVFILECAGIREQEAARRSIRICRQVEVGDGNAKVALVPSKGFSIGFDIYFDTPVIDRQTLFFDFFEDGFKREVSRARTFGFESDVERLIKLGLGRGGSLDNTVVIGKDNKILNENGLRYADEFVRHKVLDTVGDLYLAGGPLLAHFEGFRSGHSLNNRLLRTVMSDHTAWEYVYDEAVATANPGVSWSNTLQSEPIAATA